MLFNYGFKQVDNLYIYSLKPNLTQKLTSEQDQQLFWSYRKVQKLRDKLQNINLIFYIQDNQHLDLICHCIPYFLWNNKNIVSINKLYIGLYEKSISPNISIREINLKDIKQEFYNIIPRFTGKYFGFANEQPLYDFINQRNIKNKTHVITFCDKHLINTKKILSMDNLLIHNFITNNKIHINPETHNVQNFINTGNTIEYFLRQFKYFFNFKDMSVMHSITLNSDFVIKDNYNQYKIQLFSDIYILSFHKLDFISYEKNSTNNKDCIHDLQTTNIYTDKKEQVKIISDEFIINPDLEVLYPIEQSIGYIGSKIQYIINLKEKIIELTKDDNIINTIKQKIHYYIKNLQQIISKISKKIDSCELHHIKIIKKQLFELYIYTLLIRTNNNYQTEFCKQIEQYATRIQLKTSLQKIEKKIVDNIYSNDINALIKEADQVYNIIQTPTFIDYITNLEKYEFEEGALCNSIEYLISNYTLSNWFDELKHGNCLCILFKINTKDVVKSSFQYQKIHIETINTSFVSSKDYIDTLINYFNTHSTLQFGNLNYLDIIKGDGIGEGNAVLPIYISKQNWQIAKTLLKPILGIIMGHHPCSYVNVFDNLYFIVLHKMIKQLYFDNVISQPYIKNLFMIYRTSVQIMSEYGFHIGLKKYIQNIIDQPQAIIKKQQKHKVILAQIIVCGNNITDELLIKYYQYIVEKLIIKISTKQLYHTQLEILYQSCPLQKHYIPKLNNILKILFNCLLKKIPQLLYLFEFRKQLQYIYKKYGGFKAFIKYMDDNFGIINDDVINLISVSVRDKDILGFDDLTVYPIFSWLTWQWFCEKQLNYMLFGWDNKSIKINKTKHISGLNQDIFYKKIKEKVLITSDSDSDSDIKEN